jgi:hypothetical protein
MGTWSPFVKPEVVTTNLPHGHHVTFKKRLTIREQREVQDEVFGFYRQDGSMKPNYKMLGIAEMAAYIVDWSFRDEKGAAVPPSISSIGGMSDEAYRMLDEALDAHKATVKKEDEERKNAQAGESALSATSPSAA